MMEFAGICVAAEAGIDQVGPAMATSSEAL